MDRQARRKPRSPQGDPLHPRGFDHSSVFRADLDQLDRGRHHRRRHRRLCLRLRLRAEGGAGGEESPRVHHCRSGRRGLRILRAGVSDPEPDREQRAGGTLNEVRTEAEELLKGTQERNLQRDDVRGESEGALPDDSEAGRGEDGSVDIPDGEVPGSERSPESIRPDEVGGSDEQHPGIGGGDSFIGADLQLNPPDAEPEQLNMFDLFPSFAEQVGTIAAAEASVKTKAPAVFMLKDDQLLDVIRSGGGKENNRKRIYAKYQAGKDAAEMTDFIKMQLRKLGAKLYAIGIESDCQPGS